jgi:hypothetical protein
MQILQIIGLLSLSLSYESSLNCEASKEVKSEMDLRVSE